MCVRAHADPTSNPLLQTKRHWFFFLFNVCDLIDWLSTCSVILSGVCVRCVSVCDLLAYVRFSVQFVWVQFCAQLYTLHSAAVLASYHVVVHMCVCTGWDWWGEHWKLPLLSAPLYDPLAEGCRLQCHHCWPQEVIIISYYNTIKLYERLEDRELISSLGLHRPGFFNPNLHEYTNYIKKSVETVFYLIIAF